MTNINTHENLSMVEAAIGLKIIDGSGKVKEVADIGDIGDIGEVKKVQADLVFTDITDLTDLKETFKSPHAENRLRISRTYYRNPFFHIGHLNTLYVNERISKTNKGICCAIIDDRTDINRVKNVVEDFEYLDLKHVRVVSVKAQQDNIMDYTLKLIQKGNIYLYHCEEKITNIQRILNIVASPRMHIQLKLNCGLDHNDPSIGYTYDDRGTLIVSFLFDYIIKVLDVLLNVTDIVTTSHGDTGDVKDGNICKFFDTFYPIKYCKIDSYHIHNFRYSKRGWSINEKNPYLLTIKGLKARHVPVQVLKAFYLHACQMGTVKIQFLSILLSKYLYKISEKTLGVLKPIKITIDNWKQKHTEYVCGQHNMFASREIKHYPMSDTIYIDSCDYGIDKGNVNKGRTVQLSYGPVLMCTDINLQNHQTPVLHGTVQFQNTGKPEGKKIHWISSVWDEQPCTVRFYLYNWFYTGFNCLLEPDTIDGFIDNSVFTNLDQIYHLEQLGYFVYDRELTSNNNMPTFIRISKL